MPEVAKEQAKSLLQEVSDKMREPGDNPTYPINWVSEKQRRAFFATDGFGGGVPHKRTGQYQDAWTLKELPAGWRIENKSAAAPHVGGNAFGLVQSPIHKGRWNLLKDALEAENIDTKLPKRIEAEIKRIAKEQGFKV